MPKLLEMLTGRERRRLRLVRAGLGCSEKVQAAAAEVEQLAVATKRASDAARVMAYELTPWREYFEDRGGA